mmetsp:Transcript_33176/g.48653  ORF Transcript_33176/g.48653 Transcript_33176/m.48653 type:complete len:84 (-) Transcript_33176:512-763(-)|eukprot:CAMPEP_0195510834 /NCGR_PEP_ID=MMETSP0794_2-20130614/3364_1 /TAXON_ID=515487 /ORGANISM="Stephanopyxis turris, Strain CCMP 815" /LENGTH=83 /DNA_ID=CAMNT_0040638337 /DNA_START=165 /DNA_END=416 /DNA_ORIENTATION=+
MKYLPNILKVLLFAVAMADDATLDQVKGWLEAQGLNEYGDSEGTMYMGGSPLFDESTGESKDLVDYLTEKYPSKPWETGTEQL